MNSSTQRALTPSRKTGMITVIGISKLFEAALLLTVATGALRLLHHNVEEAVRQRIHSLHMDPDGRYLGGLLAKLLSVDDRKLRELGVVLFIYAGLHLTEGVGLLLHKRWAEYFTIITTSLLVPLEVYELFHHASATKIIVLILNAAIVAYLIYRLVRERSEPLPTGANRIL